MTTTIEINVGKPAFSFETYGKWVSHAQGLFRRHRLNEHNSICVDRVGRICTLGMHFKRADKDGAYPVTVHPIL